MTYDGHLADADDDQLARFLDEALADVVLAERYEHNRHLVPGIKRFIDRVRAEQSRRAATKQ